MDKEIIDEMIFRTVNKRNRLILDLMARGGMRIGEVFNITRMISMTENWLYKILKAGKKWKLFSSLRK
ncbi:MAG: hypothetical protein PVG39_27075 [Desulfobacteraceae bacterium]